MQTLSKQLSHFLQRVIAVAGVFLATPTLAADVVVDPYYEYRDEVDQGEFSYNDRDDIPWIENETKVLAVPRPEDLAKVNLDRFPSGMTMLIDRARIMVNPDDRVVRVWLWIRHDSGFEKGSFEGFRCDNFEYKIYAWANPGREPPVTKVKRPMWRAVKESGVANYRKELLEDYFCGFREYRNVAQILDALDGEFHRDIIQKGQ